MKGCVIAHGQVNGRDAVALIKDGQLDDLLIDPPSGAFRVGSVLCGVADRPMKGMGGQFIRLPAGQGYMRGGDVPPGQNVLVQVSGFAEPGKAVPVTRKLTFRGRYVIVTPGAAGVNISRQIKDAPRRAELSAVMAQVPEIEGAIVRSAAEAADDTEVLAEARRLAGVSAIAQEHSGSTALVYDGPSASEQAQADWPDGDHVDFAAFDVDELIAELRQPLVDLKTGAVFVEPTRALIAVDVNTGGDTSPAAGLKANIAAARELPRALRCRGLGGQIVIDFAPFPKKDRRAVENALRSAFKSDPIETSLVGWTPLGHFELNRKRARRPLV